MKSMPNISLHLGVSESVLKTIAIDVLMYAAILFAVMIVVAFCAGLVLGRFWPARSPDARGLGVAPSTPSAELPEVDQGALRREQT